MHLHKDGTSPIFVFGSNLAGIHGAGAAALAYTAFGAKWGVGVGPTGNAYAIPTKDEFIKPLPLDVIREHVSTFLSYTLNNRDLYFFITAVGCGLAGYKHSEIAPFFKGAAYNCSLPAPWVDYLA